jgi:hypothetical protein
MLKGVNMKFLPMFCIVSLLSHAMLRATTLDSLSLVNNSNTALSVKLEDPKGIRKPLAALVGPGVKVKLSSVETGNYRVLLDATKPVIKQIAQLSVVINNNDQELIINNLKGAFSITKK